MSCELLPQGIYLLLKYHGSKAEQYFIEDFTDTSMRLLRLDLDRMKFPHPRVANTRLEPGALVVMWWPNVSHATHKILYDSLKKSINATSLDGLSNLSISLLALEEIESTGKDPMLLACVKPYDMVLPTLHGLPLPAKRRKLGATPLLQESSQSDSITHSNTLSSTSGTISLAQKRTWDGQMVAPKPPAEVPLQTEILSSTRLSRPMAHILPAKPSTAPPPLTRNKGTPVTRGLPMGCPASIPPSTTTHPSSQLDSAMGLRGPPAGPSHPNKDAELERLRKRVSSMEEMLSIQIKVKLRLHQTANKLEQEQEARKQVEKMAAAARLGEADAIRRLEETQRLLAAETHRCCEANEHAAWLRCELMAHQNMAGRERDENAYELARMRARLLLLEDELNSARPELEHMKRDLQEEKARRRRYQHRLASVKATLKDATQEVALLTCGRDMEKLETLEAQERIDEASCLREENPRVRDKIVPKPEDVTQDTEAALQCRLKEVEDQLSKAESQLKMEMRLRQDAEDAIADIRRECREPFVVPSLLDAFVELAKLTTAATTPSGLHKELDRGVGKE